MDNVKIIEIENPVTGEIVKHAIIDHGNDQFTSMLKSTYDAQQATLASELSNPSTPQAGE